MQNNVNEVLVRGCNQKCDVNGRSRLCDMSFTDSILNTVYQSYVEEKAAQMNVAVGYVFISHR